MAMRRTLQFWPWAVLGMGAALAAGGCAEGSQTQDASGSGGSGGWGSSGTPVSNSSSAAQSSSGTGGSGTGGSGASTCGNAGDTQPCYGGDPTLAGIGACTMGTQTCVASGEFLIWGDC